MESTLRTVVKTFSYRTAVAITTFLAAWAIGYTGVGLSFLILVYTVGYITFFIQEKAWNLVPWGVTGHYESKTRTVAKTVTWRLMSLVVLYLFGLYMGMKKTEAVEWTVITNVLFIVVHYLHERAWNQILWQKNNG